MNAFIVAAIIAGSPSIQTQAAQRSFDWEPMPLPKIATKLAAVLGEPVQVSKSLAPTTMMVYAPSATVGEVQEKIAQATNGTWSKRGGVWYLEQTPAQAKADERTYQDLRRKAIQSLLDFHKKELQNLKPFTEMHARRLYEEMRDFNKIYGPNDNERVSQRVHELEMESPASRLNRRFLLAMDVDTLASVAPRDRRVFSTNPTPMQSPMPGEIAKIIDQYIEEQNVWATVTGEQPVTNANGDGLGLEFGADVKPVSGKIGTVLLTVDGYPNDGFGFRLSLFDQRGLFVLETESSNWDSIPEDQIVKASVSDTPTAPKIPQELAPESKAFLSVLFAPDRKNDRWKVVTDAMLALWRKPTLRDPLAYHVGGFLALEAAAMKKSLVAVVPDSFVDFSDYGFIADLQKFTKQSQGMSWLYDAKIAEEPNWLVLTPMNPLRSRRTYVDRAALELELAIGAQLDPPTLDEEAELALKKGPEDDFGSFNALLYTLRANPFHSGNLGTHLRVYAAMTPPGRAAAMKKGGVPLSRLPKAVQEEVHRIVYLGDPYSVFAEGDDDPESESGWPDTGRIVSSGDRSGGDGSDQEPDPKLEMFWNGILREPTVLLPKGIPLNTTISFEVESSYMVQTGPDQFGTNPFQGDLVSPAELGERVYMMANPKLFPWISDSSLNLNTSRMRLILSRQIRIVYNFQNGFRTVGSLQELRPVPNKSFTLNNLPVEIKEAFTESQKELESRMKNRKPGF